MSTFTNYQDFAFTTIEENLTIAKYCLETVKDENSDNGASCYGMPALILLCSVIDIIGTFYKTGSFSIITESDVKQNKRENTRTHFTEYYKRFLRTLQPSPCSQQEFVQYCYEYARCKATHNGILWPNVIIKNEESTPIGLIIDRQTSKFVIYLPELYKVVSISYETMKKDANYAELNLQPTGETGYSQAQKTVVI